MNCEILLWGCHCRCVMTVSFWGVLLGRSVIGGGTRNWSTWPTALKPKSCVCGENMGRKCNSTSFIPKRWDGVNLLIMVYRMRGLAWFKGFCFTMKFLSTSKKDFISIYFVFDFSIHISATCFCIFLLELVSLANWKFTCISIFQCRELYFCVKESMEKAAARNNGKLPGIDVSLHQTIILVFKNNCDHALFIYMHQNVQ